MIKSKVNPKYQTHLQINYAINWTEVTFKYPPNVSESEIQTLIHKVKLFINESPRFEPGTELIQKLWGNEAPVIKTELMPLINDAYQFCLAHSHPDFNNAHKARNYIKNTVLGYCNLSEEDLETIRVQVLKLFQSQ